MLRQFRATTILTSIILVGCLHDSGTTNVGPPPRIVSTFNTGWKFAKDLSESGLYQTPDFDDTSWEDVTLPHTPRIEPLVVNDQWQGDS
jgi:beta-galactosidase